MKLLIDQGFIANEIKADATKFYDAVKALVLASARLEGWHLMETLEHAAKVSPRDSYDVTPMSVAKYLSGLNLSEKEFEEYFNSIFSVTLKSADHLLGRKALDEVGGKKETKEFASISFS